MAFWPKGLDTYILDKVLLTLPAVLLDLHSFSISYNLICDAFIVNAPNNALYLILVPTDALFHIVEIRCNDNMETVVAERS